MVALAAVADVEAVSQPVPDGDVAQVERLIEMVSATVCTLIGQPLIEDTYTVTLTPVDGELRLPRRPVTAVAEVWQFGQLVPTDAYTCDRSGVLERTLVAPLWAGWNTIPNNYPDLTKRWPPFPVTITYTAGYPDGDAPDDLKGLVAEKVAEAYAFRILGAEQQEAVSGYSVTYRAPKALGDFDEAQQRIIRRYSGRRCSGTTRVRP